MIVDGRWLRPQYLQPLIHDSYRLDNKVKTYGNLLSLLGVKTFLILLRDTFPLKINDGIWKRLRWALVEVKWTLTNAVIREQNTWDT